MTRVFYAVATAVAILAMMGSAQAGGDVEAGKAKAKSCAGCHGADGAGKKDNPAINGQDPAAFAAAMQEYKAGTRDHKMMVKLSKKLSDEDILNLAAYYATLK